MQAYSDPKRASDPHALPNVEVFYWSASDASAFFDSDTEEDAAGWYWWACFPGCLPDSDPIGPFATEAEALADAQADASDDEETPDMSCDSCAAVMVNGAYCHEHGCPNARKVKVNGRWVAPDSDDEENEVQP